MNRKFRPPRQADEQQWKNVWFLHEHGFHFQTVYDESGASVRYPESLEEAREFVRRYPPRRVGIALRRAPKTSRRRG